MKRNCTIDGCTTQQQIAMHDCYKIHVQIYTTNESIVNIVMYRFSQALMWRFWVGFFISGLS